MPFKSEKQRRFLWAAHPDIAKRWAHKYPESNKNLPMYANEDSTDADKKPTKEKAAQFNIPAILSRIEDSITNPTPSILSSKPSENCKKADSKQEKVDIPHSEEPTYAGEEREKGMISSSVDTGKNIDEGGNENAINTLLQKLSVVLSPSIQQTMENMNAENEGRVPVRVGKNQGLKQYPVATPQIPLPMGMQMAQQPQQTKQTQPAKPTPVGAGQSSATTDPIKFHSGLSASGIINGNAALSAPNTVNTKISADASNVSPAWLRSLMGAGVFGGAGMRGGALLGGLLGAGHGAFAAPTEYLDAKGQKQKQTRLQKVLHDALTGVGVGGISGGIAGAAGGAALPFLPTEKGASNGDPIQNLFMGMEHISPDEMNDLLAEERIKSAVEKWAAIGLWDRIRAKKQRGEKPAKPGDKDYPDSKSWKKVTSISEKSSASTPAWQRAAGKNDEGGLNAKGRASYNRATGGNLKAPVTEKNPTGERNKRQNSFCSRMCGMKRVNTGAKTKSDPDSRINKALRKWNCKCGSEKSSADQYSEPDYASRLTPEKLQAFNDFFEANDGYARILANTRKLDKARKPEDIDPNEVGAGYMTYNNINRLMAANKLPVNNQFTLDDWKHLYAPPADKKAFVTGFMDDAINNATPLIGGMAGGAVGALGGGALGGLHGAVSPGEYTDEAGNKKKRSRALGALRGLLAGAGLGGVGGAVGGAVGLPMLSKKSSPAETFGKEAAAGFHEGPYRLAKFLFQNEPWSQAQIGRYPGPVTHLPNPGLGYTGAGAIGAGLGSLIGAYNAKKGKKLRGALKGGLIGAGTGLGARAAGGLAMNALDDSVLNTQYPALAAALGGGFIGSAAGAGIADGVEDDLDEHKKTAAAGGARAIAHAAEEQGIDPTVAALAGLATLGGLYGVYHGGKKLLGPVARRLSVSTLPDNQVGRVALPTNPDRLDDRYTFAERYRQPSLLGSLFIDSDEDAISRAITQATKRNPAMLRRLEGHSGSAADLDSVGKTLVDKYPHRYRLPASKS